MQTKPHLKVLTLRTRGNQDPEPSSSTSSSSSSSSSYSPPGSPGQNRSKTVRPVFISKPAVRRTTRTKLAA
jgi:hypothetical protein